MKINILLTLTILSVVANSCKTEDLAPFQSLENRIQNEGYFPLAPDNAWVFENRTAKKSGNEYVYKPDTDSIEVQSVIGSVNEVYAEDDLNPKFDYLIAPYSINNAVIGMFGSLSKVSKENGEYTRKLAVSFTDSEYTGSTFKNMKFEIDQKFLKESYDNTIVNEANPVKAIGENIHSKNYNFTSPNGGISIDYTVETEVVEKLFKMPSNLTSKEGVDKQLEEYRDILHTRDIITIKKVVLTEKLSNRLNLDAVVQIDSTGGSVLSMDIPKNAGFDPLRPDQQAADLEGVLQVGDLEQLWTDLGLDFGILVNLWVFNIDKLGLKSISRTSMCSGIGNIKVNSELIGKPMETITNQQFMIIDQYWAKGVGNIKNITEYKKLSLYMDGKDYLMTEPFKVKINKKDPNCGVGADGPGSGQENTIGITIQLNVNVSNFKLDIPFILSEDILIQNLKRYKIRNTLN